jgi:hypothetical protein
MLLLELTRALLDRAELDDALPMPVVFPLASWAAKRLPLADWLVEELSQRYDVPRQIGQSWVANERILPLLDGVDEVLAEHRAACVEAINIFLDTRVHVLPGLVVTSRAVDYDALNRQLRLQGAVLLRPLRPEQIETYVASAGGQLAGLRATLDSDPAFREFAASPLVLSTMTLAYQGSPAEGLPKSSSLEDLRGHLFATYVKRMFERRAVAARYSDDQTLRSLGWLARALIKQDQTTFYLERMQPEWLPTRALRVRYTVVDRVGTGLGIGLLIGLIVGVPAGLRLGFAGGLTLSLGIGSAGAALGALFGDSCEAPRPASGWKSPLRVPALRDALLGWLAVGLVIGLTSSLLAWVIDGPAGLVVGLGNGLVVGVAGGLAGALSGRPRLTARRIAPVESIRWSFSSAAAHAGTGLVFGLVVGGVIGLVVGLVVGLAIGTDVALVTGALALLGAMVLGTFCALLFGIVGGVSGREVEKKIGPNQGIRRSAATAMRIGLSFGLLSGLFVWLFTSSIYRQAELYDVTYGLSYGVIFGVLFAVVGALEYGGYACCSHVALRLVLWKMGSLPMDAIGFLDYSTERIFLRRVGGGYIFAHRLLQEYFANPETVADSDRFEPPSGVPAVD